MQTSEALPLWITQINASGVSNRYWAPKTIDFPRLPRSESPRASAIPDFLQRSPGKVDANASTSTGVPVQSSARQPVHDDTNVLRVMCV
jgi:hypothetical protein